MPPKRLVLLLLFGFALGAIPYFLAASASAVATGTPWYRSATGWIGLIGLLWTAIVGIGGAVISGAIALRMRSIFGLAFAIAVAAATVALVRLYFRALF